jgi:hypothetical protein
MLRLRWPARSIMDSLPGRLAPLRATCSFFKGNIHGITRSVLPNMMECNGLHSQSSAAAIGTKWFIGRGKLIALRNIKLKVDSSHCFFRNIWFT